MKKKVERKWKYRLCRWLWLWESWYSGWAGRKVLYMIRKEESSKELYRLQLVEWLDVKDGD